MKVCNRCGETKPLSEYYKHKQMSDGHLNQCKTCVKARVAKHREENIDAIREYDRNRPNHKERVEATKQRYKKYRQLADPEWLEKDRQRIRKYRANNPEKYKAQSAVNHAVRDGVLEKPDSCSRCDSTEGIQGHHWSYKEEHWLDVIWLCPKCHAEEHVRLRAEGVDPDM